MMDNQIGRGVVSFAAMVGLLAVGVAACGKPASGPANTQPAISASSPIPVASASPAGISRAAACAKYEEAKAKVPGPVAEIQAAGDDTAKIKIEVGKLQTVLDTFAADLTKISEATADKELQEAFKTAAADTKRFKQTIESTAPNQQSLYDVFVSTDFDKGLQQVEKLCTG